MERLKTQKRRRLQAVVALWPAFLFNRQKGQKAEKCINPQETKGKESKFSQLIFLKLNQKEFIAFYLKNTCINKNSVYLSKDGSQLVVGLAELQGVTKTPPSYYNHPVADVLSVQAKCCQESLEAGTQRLH